MRNGLVILPFIALFVGAVATAVGSGFPGTPWIPSLGWASAFVIVALWILLDWNNFVHFFTRKGARYGASSGAVVILSLLVILGAAILSNRPRFNKSYDASKDKLNTLSDQSIKLIEKLKTQKTQVNVLAFLQSDQVENTFKDLMRLYQAQGANFAIDYIDPQREPARTTAEKITTGNTVIFRLGSNESRISTFSEEKITNALVKVLKETSKKVYFTKGHGEGEIKSSEAAGFSAVVQELQNHKYVVEPLSILEKKEIPGDADLVVIGGPTYDFKDDEIKALEAFLARGGGLLVMVDATKTVKSLNQLIEKYGIRFRPDFLVLRPDDPRVQLRLVGQENAIVSEFDEFNPVTRDFAKQGGVALLLRNARTLEEVPNNPNAMKVTLAGKTTANAVVRIKDVAREQDLANIDADRIDNANTSFPVIAVAAGDIKTDDKQKDGRRRETRIVVVGSSEFARNQGAQASEHVDMFVNMANYLLQDEDFISIRPKDPAKTTIKLTTAGSQVSLLFLAFIYPFVFLGGGVIYWLRRRKV